MANNTAKNTICVWYDKDAEAAARFYAETFPDSAVKAVHRAPSDYPMGKAGDVLTVEFTVAGIPCVGLNGGPVFKHTEAFSFQIATDNQEETDRYWNAIVGNGGQESACGWCKDKWGLNWQITPRVLTDAMAAGGARSQACVRSDDDHEEDRRCQNRGGAAGVRFSARSVPDQASLNFFVSSGVTTVCQLQRQLMHIGAWAADGVRDGETRSEIKERNLCISSESAASQRASAASSLCCCADTPYRSCANGAARAVADYKIRIAPTSIEIAPGKVIRTTAYNGTVPGPVLRMKEGQPVRIEVTNDSGYANLIPLPRPVYSLGAGWIDGRRLADHRPRKILGLFVCRKALRHALVSQPRHGDDRSHQEHLFRRVRLSDRRACRLAIQAVTIAR